jgi:hypothetical protein
MAKYRLALQGETEKNLVVEYPYHYSNGVKISYRGEEVFFIADKKELLQGEYLILPSGKKLFIKVIGKNYLSRIYIFQNNRTITPINKDIYENFIVSAIELFMLGLAWISIWIIRKEYLWAAILPVITGFILLESGIAIKKGSKQLLAIGEIFSLLIFLFTIFIWIFASIKITLNAILAITFYWESWFSLLSFFQILIAIRVKEEVANIENKLDKESINPFS